MGPNDQKIMLSMAGMSDHVKQLALNWPNNREVLHSWLPLSKVMVYIAKDETHLPTLLSRIPSEWTEATRMPLREWFDLPAVEKKQYVDQHLILTYNTSFSKVEYLDLPGLFLFLPYSVMIEQNGIFNDARDHTGYEWGSYETEIPSSEILSGERTL